VGPGPARRVLMSGVYEARNTDFAFNYQVKGGPLEQAKAVSNAGREPVLVTPVQYTVWLPTDVKGTFQSFDFALREIGDVKLDETNKIVQTGATPFIDTISIDARGKPASEPLAQATEIPLQSDHPLVAGEAGGGAPAASSGSSLPILPELPWDQNYSDAHRALRDSTLTFTNISKEDLSNQPKKQLEIVGGQLPSLWKDLADIILYFEADKATMAEVTFSEPPAVDTVLEDFTKRLGPPAEVDKQAQFGTTRLHWVRHDAPHDVLVTESQGVMKILVSR